MANPYRVLGIDETQESGAAHRRYLELVRRFPPERDPEVFRRIRAAYDKIADERSRLSFLLFEPGRGESLDEWIEEIGCERKERRWSLDEIRAFLQRA